MTTPSKFIQMVYTPANPHKYVGKEGKELFLRSSFELAMARWLDFEPTVLKWGCENIEIPYFDPVRKTNRRYIMDFIVYGKGIDGKDKITMIEVKPSKQAASTPPKRGKKSDKTFEAETRVWITNQAKWKAAKEFAEERGWSFVIFTEKNLLPSITSIKATFNKKKKTK